MSRLEAEERKLADLEQRVAQQRFIVAAARAEEENPGLLPDEVGGYLEGHDHTPLQPCWRGCPAQR